jgi:hypothetical protein
MSNDSNITQDIRNPLYLIAIALWIPILLYFIIIVLFVLSYVLPSGSCFPKDNYVNKCTMDGICQNNTYSN